jgi:hypothetical protein
MILGAPEAGCLSSGSNTILNNLLLVHLGWLLIFVCTVKPVKRGHPRDLAKLSSLERCLDLFFRFGGVAIVTIVVEL